jgi:hypothetical protein
MMCILKKNHPARPAPTAAPPGAPALTLRGSQSFTQAFRLAGPGEEVQAVHLDGEVLHALRPDQSTVRPPAGRGGSGPAG